MRIALLVNDSYFSYLIAKPLLQEFGRMIRVAVFSTRTTGSWKMIWGVYRKTHVRYFTYRCLVDLVSRIKVGQPRTVRALLAGKEIEVLNATNLAAPGIRERLNGMHVAVALNFDQIVRPDVLNRFPNGILNAHASRLPHDKGISPALWAFARGDAAIWTTIYAMGPEVDCGTIYDQFPTPVDPMDTGFSVYQKVCRHAGSRLTEVLKRLELGQLHPVGESRADMGNYNGWPNAQHRGLLAQSRRKLISARDLIRVFSEK